MKIRGNQIVLAVVVVIVGVLAFTVVHARMSPKTERPNLTDEAFFEQIHEEVAENPLKGSEAGVVPPVVTDLSNKPKIAVENEHFDMGVIANDRPTTQRLSISNEGAGLLRISQVTTTCGCTTGEIEKKELKPGEKTDLEVTIYPNQIRGFYTRKTLTIQSNDPVRSSLNIPVEARIDPEFYLEPTKLEFGSVEKGEVREATVVLRQAGKKPIKVQAVSVPERWKGLKATFKPTPESEWTEPGKAEYEIHLRLDSDKTPTGSFRGGYVVETNCQRIGKLFCDVTADVKSFYKVDLPTISFGMLPPGGKKEGAVTISADRPFEITDLTTGDSAFTVTSRPGEAPYTVVLDLETSKDAATGYKTDEANLTIQAGEQVFHESIRIVGKIQTLPAPMLPEAQEAAATAQSPAQNSKTSD
jgi:hypothetical protein